MQLCRTQKVDRNVNVSSINHRRISQIYFGTGRTKTVVTIIFAEHVVNVWNSLWCDSIDFSSLKSFQHTICAVDLSGSCMGSTYQIKSNKLYYSAPKS